MPSLDRPRVDYRTPEDLVRDVRSGLLRIPQFQRGFKWEAGDVVKLFDSLLQGFPIGNLLLWRRPAPAQRVQVGPLTVDAPELDAALWVVDGQQRITSIVGALTAADQSSDSRFRVHLDLDSGEFHTAGLRQQPPRSWLPVRLLLDTATLLRWMRENSDWITEDQLALADRAAEALREYRIPIYIVTAQHEEAVREIFMRTNTTGKQLTRAEVFQALHSGFAADEPATLHTVAADATQLGFGRLDEDLVLRCLLALRGRGVLGEDIRETFGSDDEWVEALHAVAAELRDVVGFLRATAGIPHVKLLPYPHVLPVLVRFVHLYGAPQARAAILLRRWVWRFAVEGPRARGLSVTDMRGPITAIEADDDVEAASRLLAQVRAYPDFAVDLDRVHFNHAMTKLNVLGLLSAEPRDPSTGQPIDVVALLDRGSPLRTLVPVDPMRPIEGADTIANRVVLPANSGPLPLALIEAPADVAESHLIAPEAINLLARGDISGFVQRRGARAAETIREHVGRMAEWGARDGRAVADLLRGVA